MNKSIHFMVVAAGALIAYNGSAAANAAHGFSRHINVQPVTMLWNQNSNYASQAVSSQNYTSGLMATFNDVAADDFVVPPGQSWRISEVDVSGQYSGSGSATSENVAFYFNGNDQNGNNLPRGHVDKLTFSGLAGTDSNGNFSITLPGTGIVLPAGTYWVSVQVNMNAETEGEWYWGLSSVQHGNVAAWQNKSGYGKCPTWGTITACQGIGPDLMFDLQGTVCIPNCFKVVHPHEARFPWASRALRRQRISGGE
jgi:hypothetical protein